MGNSSQPEIYKMINFFQSASDLSDQAIESYPYKEFPLFSDKLVETFEEFYAVRLPEFYKKILSIQNGGFVNEVILDEAEGEFYSLEIINGIYPGCPSSSLLLPYCLLPLADHLRANGMAVEFSLLNGAEVKYFPICNLGRRFICLKFSMLGEYLGVYNIETEIGDLQPMLLDVDLRKVTSDTDCE